MVRTRGFDFGQLKVTDTVTVAGMKGTGKSTLSEGYATYLIENGTRVFWFDPMGEHLAFKPNVYVPKTMSPNELDWIAQRLWKAGGDVVLFVDEAELYLPNKLFLPPTIFKTITQGRHVKIGLVAITRRVANLNKTVFSLSEHCFVFRHFSNNDIRYLSDFLNDARPLRDLDDYWFWHYHRGTMKEYKPLRIVG